VLSNVNCFVKRGFVMNHIRKIVLLSLSVAAVALSGCGGSGSGSGSNPHPPSPSGNYSLNVTDSSSGTVRFGQTDTLLISIASSAALQLQHSNLSDNQIFTVNVSDSNTAAPVSLIPSSGQIALGDTLKIVVTAPQTAGAHKLKITFNQDGNSIGEKDYELQVSPGLNELGKVYYHIAFPVTDLSGESVDLTNPAYTNLILSNYVAGVLYGHLLKEKVPGINFDTEKDYLYGSVFAQLLQENNSTMSYGGCASWSGGCSYINSPVQRTILLNAGQGGPYQINDYSKRLPGVNTNGSLGLINYTALQASLAYTIAAQDNNSQTLKTGPDALDNIYFGPIAAAYFHFNDWTRITLNNSTSWAPQPEWSNCAKTLNTSQFPYLDMVMNASYNAGTYSPILKTYIDLCADPSKYQAEISNINNYNLDDTAYISNFSKVADPLPSSYKKSTFILYPRQVRFYLDQLYSNNSKLSPAGLTVNNQLNITLQDLESVFTQSMHTLAYEHAGKYSYISLSQAKAAFDSAISGHGLSLTISFADSQDRETMYTIIDKALANLESSLNFKFGDTTEVDHQPSA
jgi:hypothetical protein